MGNKQPKQPQNRNNKGKSSPEIKPEKEKIEEIQLDRYKYNILFIGSKGIGTKTSLIKAIMGDKYIDNINEQKFIYKKNNKEIIFLLIDTDGEEKNRKYISMYYKYADCIVMGYDATNKNSFEEMEYYWYKQVKEKSKTKLIFLLGNKNDLKFKIKVKENKGKRFSDLNHLKFLSISVKNNTNIDKFITYLKSSVENNVKNDINNGIKEVFYGNPSKESFKTVLLGDSGVGSKTSLVNAVVHHNFDPCVCSTNGASYSSKMIPLKNGRELIIDIWDTAGQERYRALTKFFITDCHCIVLGFDVTRKSTFESIQTFWYPFSKENTKVELFYLLANKIDRLDYDYVYDFENEVINYAKENNLRYFAISCRTFSGIQTFMDDLANELIKR